MNTFKDLENELVRDKGDRIMKIQHKLTYTKNLLTTIGDVADLYIPKLAETFIRMGSSNKNDTEQRSKYPHEN